MCAPTAGPQQHFSMILLKMFYTNSVCELGLHPSPAAREGGGRKACFLLLPFSRRVSNWFKKKEYIYEFHFKYCSKVFL